MNGHAQLLYAMPAPVTRENLLERLAGLFQEMRSGRSRSCALFGPAGIGKSWLLRACHQRFKEQVLCSWGYGEAASGAPALWPFIEALRGLQRQGQALHCRNELKAILSPWGLGGKTSQNALEDAQARRFLISEEIVSLLLNAAQQRPLCLLFEDVHAFDTASLTTLGRLLSRAHEAPLLVLSSIRDPHPTAEGSALPTVLSLFEQHWTVPGLTLPEVRAWLSSELDPAVVADAFCAEVHQRAEGNPLYLASVISQLSRGGRRASLTTLPQGLLLAAEAQLDALSGRGREALRWAAVLGAEFELSLLRGMLREGGTEDHLQRAVRHGILQDVEGNGRLRFTHGLLQEVLLSELSPAEAAQAHAAAERSLETRKRASAKDDSQQAFHALHTRSEDGYRRATDLYTRIGLQASHRGAQHEAAHAYQGAEQGLLALLELAAKAQHRILELELATRRLDRARALWFCGHHEQTRELCAQVTAIAIRQGDAELQAQAALTALGTDLPVQVDPAQIAMCEDALRAFSDHRTLTAIQLLVRLGTLLCLSDRWERGRALIATARDACPAEHVETIDPLLVLARFYALPDLAGRDERWALIARGLQIIQATNDLTASMWVRLWEIRWHMEHGKLSTVHSLCQAHLKTTERFGDPLPRWNAHMALAAHAMRTGDLDRAMLLAEQARDIGRCSNGPNVDIAFLAQQLSVELLRGHLEEIVELIQVGAEQFPHLLSFRATLAAVRAELGQWPAAHLDFIRTCDALTANVDATTVHALCQLAQAAFWLAQAPKGAHGYGPEARAHTGRLREQLLPLVDRWVVVGQLQACGGPVTYYLGLLELSLLSHTPAEAHLRDALHQSRIQGAMVWVAHSHFALSCCLQTRPACRLEATEHAEQALRLALGMGLQALARHSQAQLTELAATPPAPRQPNTANTPAAFQRQGDIWRIAYADRCALLSHLKGMRYLEHLLSSPTHPVHVLDLLRACGELHPEPSCSVAGELERHGRIDTPLSQLDAPAVQAYRKRAKELVDAITEAKHMQDLGRLQPLQEELEVIQQQLLEARRIKHPPTERARKAVYNRIRTAIAHIETELPELARHLRASIKTGTHCSYYPSHAQPWNTATNQGPFPN